MLLVVYIFWHPSEENNSGLELLSGEAGTRIELHAAVRWIEQAFPFLLLLTLVFLYQHRTGSCTTSLSLSLSLYAIRCH